MLERAGAVHARELSRSSVHRLLCVHGASARPLRGPAAERRSFLLEHPGAGKTYDLLKKGDPWPTFQKNYTALLQRSRADLAQNLQAAGQQTIPVPGPDAKILPGKSKDFILPFNAAEAQPPLKLMVYDLVTASDAAGNASVKDNFDFAIAKTRAELWRHRSDATGAIEWNETEPTPAECE